MHGDHKKRRRTSAPAGGEFVSSVRAPDRLRRTFARSVSPATCVVLAAQLLAASHAADNIGGGWLSPSQNNWPLIPIHAALTPDGRVLTYGTDGSGVQTGYFIYDVWDPSAGLSNGHITLENRTLTDLFCSAQVIIPDSGRIFIAGGDNWTGTGTTNTGNNNTNLYRYSDDTLARGPNMNRPRWYATTTVLPNGEIYVQGGSGGADRPEVRGLTGGLRLLTNVDTSALDWWYPRNFVAADGRVFGYTAGGKMYYINPAGTGSYTPVGQFASAYRGRTSSAAMFRPGRILQFGGNSNGAIVIDIRSGSPVITPTRSLSTQRQWVSATVLADGRVLATGGSTVANQLTGVNNHAEIWDPATEQWTLGPSGRRARLYHSGALLLPDASVLVHGGGAPGPQTNLHAEIYYPPYLYDASGAFRPRPVISSAPASIDLGVDFSVVSNSSNIRRVTLVKTGSVTHSVNMEQRFLELTFTQSSTTSFVQAPDSATDAPPGYYLLFVIDDQGVPSVARIVRLNLAGSSPPPPQDSTPTIGGTGGDPFSLSCDTGEALVGVYGFANDSVVKRVGLRCVRVDSAAHWVGDPVNRGATGGSSGSAYTKTCPRNFAIAGFKGRASDVVNQLNFECRSLDPSGQLVGGGQFLGPIGGSGGAKKGPFRCATNNPGYALAGRSSGKINAISLQCRRAPT
jgi:hypothetical protein